MSDKGKLIGTISDLHSELEDYQESLQNLVFQKSMQQLEDLSQLKKTKKKIARLKTLIHDIETSQNS